MQPNVLLLSLPLMVLAASAPAQTQWKAGVAKVVITPTESIWMAGYAARTKPSEGVQTDLYLKALALDDGSGRASVLVTSDLVGLRRQVADVIAERCEKEYGLTRDRLVINSSHTHSGPTTGEFAPRVGYQSQQQVIRRYTDALIEKAVGTVGAA